MFRKLFALEVAALASNDDYSSRAETRENEVLSNLREVFAPRTGNYGTMWSTRSAG